MANKEEIGIFQEANQVRAEIGRDSGDKEWVIPPAIASLILGISVKNLGQMAEGNQSLTITPLSSEKVRISKKGFKSSGRLYRELFLAVQKVTEGQLDAFNQLSSELYSWKPLEEFLEDFNEGGGQVEVEEMQDLLQAYWQTLKTAIRINLDNEELNPSRVISSGGIRRSGV